MLYHYTGPELPLGIQVVTLREMQVDTLAMDGETWRATGSLTYYDYLDKFRGECNWVACLPPGKQWEIRPLEYTFWRDRETLEPIFTAYSLVNDAIVTFIAEELIVLQSTPAVEKPKPLT